MVTKDHNETESEANVTRRFFPTWFARTGLEAMLGVLIVLAGLLAVLGGLSYRYRESIGDSYMSFQETMITWLGLGTVSLALWLVVSLWVVTRHPQWLRKANLWVASLALLAVIVGILAFFGPDRGVLGEFTLDGEVNLGGKTGTAITGPVGELFTGIPRWEGALRVLGVFAVGIAIALPVFAADVAMTLGRLAVYVYLFVIVGARGLVSGLGRIYQPDPSEQSERRETRREAPRVSPSPAAPPQFSGVSSPPVDTPAPSVFAETLTVTPAPLALGPGVVSVSELDEEEADLIILEADEGEEQQAPEPLDTPSAEDESAAMEQLTAKFNRYWSEELDPAQEAPEMPESTPRTNGAVGVEAGGAQADREPEGGQRGDGPTPILSPVEDLWARPSTELLLEAPEGGITQGEMDETAENIKRTLADYGVEVEIGQTRPGPTVTMYGLIPGWVRRYKQVREKNEDGSPKLDESGKPVISRVESKTRVKVDSILSREKDLALALKTPSIRIETPVMGQSLLGIEVPNPTPSLVTLRSVMESKEFQRLRAKALLPIALGKGSGGETVVVDLAKMPHLLIAGATGSGKSVCINTIISCLILEKTPAEMRLLLIDPKRVELTPYNGIPHLLTPVVVETDQVVGLLKGLINEMLNRYRLMEEVAGQKYRGIQ